MIFPRTLDNVYRGQWPGLWLFVLFLALKLLMSVNSILNTRTVAEGADGIPLDTYGGDGAAMVLLLFSLLSWSQLVMALFAVLVLLRYRAMVPLMFVIFLVEHLGRRVVLAMHETERGDGASIGFYINFGLSVLLVIGFLLSIWPRRARLEDRT